MKRAAIRVLLAASLLMPAAAQSSDHSAHPCASHSVESAHLPFGERSADPQADGRRLALHVHYVRYSRHDEWCRLRVAGLSDLEAVEVLLAAPRGAELTFRTLP